MKKIIPAILGIGGLIATVLAFFVLNAKRQTATVGSVALLAMQTNAATVNITGAGSTFDYPAFTKWFEAYGKVDPDVQIQLPIHRFRRRHQKSAQPDGGFRRFRRADEG